MEAPDLSTRVADLESRLAALVTTHTADRQIIDKLRRALDYDSATDAYSRSYFETALAHELRHFRRDDHDRLAVPLTLAIVDVDHFKQINDSAGHLTGDRALREVVDICRAHLQRDTDVVARYGGDEFALLLPQTPIDSATPLLQKIRRDVSACIVDGIRLSVSIGAATCPHHGRTPRDLFAAADRALYRAKQTRDTVACAE